VEKYGRTGQTTGDNMQHAKYMLDNKRYKHTLRIQGATQKFLDELF
jgi:hypothetical protein